MKLVREYPQHSILFLDLRNSQMAFGGLLETASEAPESMVKRMENRAYERYFALIYPKIGPKMAQT